MQGTIRTKFTLALLGVALLPLAVSGICAYRNVRHALEREVLHHLQSVAELQKHHLADVITHYQERLALVASRTHLRRSFAQFLQTQDPHAQTRMTQILQDAQTSVADFLRMTVYTLDGRAVASTDPARIGHQAVRDPDAGNAPIAQDTLRVARDPAGHLRLELTKPLFLAHEVLGAIHIETTAERLIKLVSDHTGLGRTGETLVVERDADGNARFLTPTRFDPQAAPTRTVPKDATAGAPIIRALQRHEHLLPQAIDYRGVPVLAATAHLPAQDWGVVVKMDVAEVFAPVVRLRHILILMGVLTSSVVVAVAFILARTITTPLTQLTVLAERISQGDLAQRATPATTDEIGALAQAFNRMTGHLIEANEHLAQRAQDLSRSNADLEQFAYVASHDLQEPLRKVANYTKLFAQRYQGHLDARAEKYITYIVDGATRMQQLIQDLLMYSRAGRADIHLEPTAMDAVLKETLATLAPALHESGAEVSHDPLPTVMAHALQIGQVFQNLLGNALKFRGDAPPRVHIGVQSTAQEWLFTVTDNGIGLEPQYAARIFTIFQRLHAPRAYPGTGIGLAICKKIVERHGGRIWVESQPGQGSTFFFTLPNAAHQRFTNPV